MVVDRLIFSSMAWETGYMPSGNTPRPDASASALLMMFMCTAHVDYRG